MDLRQEELRERLASLGFDDVRFTTLRALDGDRLGSWLGAGMHGDMQWMERTAEKRLQPDLVLPGAKSIIMLGVNYWGGGEGAEHPSDETERPRWARYARYEDYHDTMKSALVEGGRALEEICGLA